MGVPNIIYGSPPAGSSPLSPDLTSHHDITVSGELATGVVTVVVTVATLVVVVVVI